MSPESDVRISPDDRAFQYGDGLFETLRYERGRIAFWPDHYHRLTQGMTALRIDRPDWFTPETLHEQIRSLLLRNNLTRATARLKIQVWRQTGGLYTPTNSSANILITTRAAQPFAVGKKDKVGIFGEVRLSGSPVSAYKTLNALPYVLAGLAKQAGSFDEMILLDTGGHVAECVASALFWLRDETLCMPSLATGCIDGIMRRQLLRLAPDLGFRVREGLFLPDELALADAVFCGNVMGVQRLRAVNGVVINEKKPLGADTARKLNDLFGRLV